MSLSLCCHGLKPGINKPVHIRNERVRLYLYMYLYYSCDWYHYGYTTYTTNTLNGSFLKSFVFEFFQYIINFLNHCLCFYNFSNRGLLHSLWFIIIILPCEFFSLALSGGFSLASEWQQVSSDFQDSSQYSGWSQKCWGLNVLDSSSDF